MKKELPNSKLIRLKKIGHSHTLEGPDLVIPEIIGRFSDPRV